MVYYANCNNKTIDEMCYDFISSVDEIVHEYEMSILSDKYNFICENGYEMPLHEAEEKKENIFKRIVNMICARLKVLKNNIIKAFNNWKDKLNKKNTVKSNKVAKDVDKKASDIKDRIDNATKSFKEADPEDMNKIKNAAHKVAADTKKDADEVSKAVEAELVSDEEMDKIKNNSKITHNSDGSVTYSSNKSNEEPKEKYKNYWEEIKKDIDKINDIDFDAINDKNPGLIDDIKDILGI